MRHMFEILSSFGVLSLFSSRLVQLSKGRRNVGFANVAMIKKNVKKMVKESSACLHKLSFSWVTLSFVGYYVLSLLIAAILALAAPDLLTGKSMSVFFDPRD